MDIQMVGACHRVEKEVAFHMVDTIVDRNYKDQHFQEESGRFHMEGDKYRLVDEVVDIVPSPHSFQFVPFVAKQLLPFLDDVVAPVPRHQVYSVAMDQVFGQIWYSQVSSCYYHLGWEVL